jgi:hypothetical protein
MSLELPPLIADWLADDTYGVNAILATIPRDVGDALPPDVFVVDEVRTAWAARRLISAENVTAGHPAVIVGQSAELTYPTGRAQLTAQGARMLEGTATYLIMYAQHESDSAKAASNSRYTLRAILNSLILMHDPKSTATIERNGATLGLPRSFKMSTLLEERSDSLVTGGVLAEYNIRELVQSIT